MAYVRKRGDKWSFTIDVGRDPVTGKRKQKTVSGFPTRKAAEKACAELVTDIERGDYVDSRTKVRQFVTDWMESHVKHTISESTFELQMSYVINHILPSFGDMEMGKVTPLHISKFYSAKLEEGLSTGHIINLGIFLNKVFKTAMEWGMVNKNVVSAVRRPTNKKKNTVVWDEKEMNKFLKETQDSPYHVVYLLALTTGMRKGEILGLQWKHVDFQNDTISVQQTVVYANKKLYLTEPKTSSSKRVIDIPKSVVKYLREYKLRQLPNESDMVIAGQGKDILLPAILDRAFLKDVRAADVPTIRFHDMRHTHATLALKFGENPKVIQERLGHSNITTTLNTYSHVLPSMQKGIAEKFNEALEM